ncbi:TRAF-like superfamily protein [Tasmannia lanceolata]|uniref:TRAF-like superfamily protein n=1 Tax=Tasmannia lanceolata TaxID=3420 RepID=UPI004063866E
MDLPILDVGVDQNKVEAVKDGGPLFCCDLCDTELAHKIAQVLLPGLATACVDNTTGDLFKSPALVAVDMRADMVNYLTQRSEAYVAETVIQQGSDDTEASDHPTEIVSDFVDDFSSSKRNLFSRVSGWLLSEKREDKIDDFVQEMEINGFWSMDRREGIAKTLLKNVDFKSMFHCEMKFETVEALTEHKSQCKFRSLICTSEGCGASFCALHLEKHDGLCPFKILPCEQKCSESIVRREMDRHCITVCPMKLVNCPFYQVGCHSAFPHCSIKQHCLKFLRSHLLYVLHVIHKDLEADLNQHLLLLEKSPSYSQLSEALDVRSLTHAIKEQEAKLKTVEIDVSTDG